MHSQNRVRGVRKVDVHHAVRAFSHLVVGYRYDETEHSLRFWRAIALLPDFPALTLSRWEALAVVGCLWAEKRGLWLNTQMMSQALHRMLDENGRRVDSEEDWEGILEGLVKSGVLEGMGPPENRRYRARKEALGLLGKSERSRELAKG